MQNSLCLSLIIIGHSILYRDTHAHILDLAFRNFLSEAVQGLRGSDIRSKGQIQAYTRYMVSSNGVIISQTGVLVGLSGIMDGQTGISVGMSWAIVGQTRVIVGFLGS